MANNNDVLNGFDGGRINSDRQCLFFRRSAILKKSHSRNSPMIEFSSDRRHLLLCIETYLIIELKSRRDTAFFRRYWREQQKKSTRMFRRAILDLSNETTTTTIPQAIYLDRLIKCDDAGRGKNHSSQAIFKVLVVLRTTDTRGDDLIHQPRLPPLGNLPQHQHQHDRIELPTIIE